VLPCRDAKLDPSPCGAKGVGEAQHPPRFACRLNPFAVGAVRTAFPKGGVSWATLKLAERELFLQDVLSIWMAGGTHAWGADGKFTWRVGSTPLAKHRARDAWGLAADPGSRSRVVHRPCIGGAAAIGGGLHAASDDLRGLVARHRRCEIVPRGPGTDHSNGPD